MGNHPRGRASQGHQAPGGAEREYRGEDAGRAGGAAHGVRAPDGAAGGVAQGGEAGGIADQLLKWKGIEATEKLAESSNSKMIVMGNSKDSLPVLLSSDADAGPTSSSPAQSATRLRGSASPTSVTTSSSYLAEKKA